MLKKILFYSALSALILACDSPQTEKKPSLDSFPSVSLTNKKVVQSVGVSHNSKKIIITNSFTGKEVESCGKTNISQEDGEFDQSSQEKSTCKVEILNVKENQAFLNLLEQINNFKQPLLIKRKGEIQKVTANFIMMANYKGSCGSLTNSGGDQVESEVDCDSPQALICKEWVAAGYTFVKSFPPCKQYYQ